MLWYPVDGDNTIRQAPDAMVVFGRAKGDRGSYQQWKEDNIPPQVVFEILSPGNRLSGTWKKYKFYEQYLVDEYYVYDPDDNELIGWQRSDNYLDVIEIVDGWISPRLQIRFEVREATIEIYRPDGKRFLSFTELGQQVEQEQQRADQERRRADRLAERLRQLGIDPETV